MALLGTESSKGLISDKKKEDKKRDILVSTGLNCSHVGLKSGFRLLMERAQAVVVVMASLKPQILVGAVAGTN